MLTLFHQCSTVVRHLFKKTIGAVTSLLMSRKYGLIFDNASSVSSTGLTIEQAQDLLTKSHDRSEQSSDVKKKDTRQNAPQEEPFLTDI